MRTPWKEAVERYFGEFMAFFFPNAHGQIDWSKGYTFLDQELHAVIRDAEIGKRLLDKLAVVTLRTGQESSIYVHIEVQGTMQEEFPERMFVYNYRIYDRHQRPVASMAVLADDSARWRPTEFGYDVLGCQMGIHFPVVKLLDYVGREEELAANHNPFALFTLAHLKTMTTCHDPQARFDARWTLVQMLYNRNWDEQRVMDLMFVMDWMMHLPEHLEQQLWENVKQLEQEKKMAYVSSLERHATEQGVQQGVLLGMEKGLEQGIEQGLEKGLVRGLERGAAVMLMRLLTRRFGGVPQPIQDRIAGASVYSVESWFDRAISSDSLANVFDEPSQVTH